MRMQKSCQQDDIKKIKIYLVDKLTNNITGIRYVNGGELAKLYHENKVRPSTKNNIIMVEY